MWPRPQVPLTLYTPEVSIPMWALVHLPITVTLSTAFFTPRGFFHAATYVLFENAMGLVKLYAVVAGLLNLSRAQEWVVTTKLGASDARPTAAGVVAGGARRTFTFYLAEAVMSIFVLASAVYGVLHVNRWSLGIFLVLQGELAWLLARPIGTFSVGGPRAWSASSPLQASCSWRSHSTPWIAMAGWAGARCCCRPPSRGPPRCRSPRSSTPVSPPQRRRTAPPTATRRSTTAAQWACTRIAKGPTPPSRGGVSPGVAPWLCSASPDRLLSGASGVQPVPDPMRSPPLACPLAPLARFRRALTHQGIIKI